MANLNKMLKQAQKMQRDLEMAQNELADTEVTFSGNGVKIVATCDFTIKSIEVEHELFESPDKEMFEDVLMVAVNGVLDKIRNKTESRLSGLTGGMNIPGRY